MVTPPGLPKPHSPNLQAGFDPRAVPVLACEHHPPPVPSAEFEAEALRQRFRKPPIWKPDIRAEPLFNPARPAADAAVLIAIVQRAQPTVLLTERTAHLSSHPGQIAFAGGRVDAGDADVAATALREAWEEVGLPPEAAEILGALPAYTTGSAFVVTPVVALVQPGLVLRPNPYEVASIFEVPLAFLMNPARHRRHLLMDGAVQRTWWSMPYNDGGTERFIWGATAGMLRNLYRFLSA